MSAIGQWLAPDPGGVRPEDFSGRFNLYDDGCTGRLLLRHDQGLELSGSFWSYRFEDKYEVSASVDAAEPHRIELVIHNFNWMARQTYSAWLFTQGKEALAGSSLWMDRPFGFFARRANPLKLSAYRSGGVEPADFAGEYGGVIDGRRATVTLRHEGSDRLGGRCRSQGLGVDLAVAAQVGVGVPHAIRMEVAEDPGLTLEGYLFTEPKNAIAGSLVWRDMRLGFYMTRYLSFG